MNRILYLCPVLAAALLGTAGSARAGFIVGSPVTGSYTMPGTGLTAPQFSPTTVALSESAEEFRTHLTFDMPFGLPDYFKQVQPFIDLTSTTLHVGFNWVMDPTAPTNGFDQVLVPSLKFEFTLTGLQSEPGSQITGLTIQTNGRNTTAPNNLVYSTTADSITVGFSSFSFLKNQTNPAATDVFDDVTFNVQFGPVHSTPEPSSLALVTVGVLTGAAGRTLRKQ